MVAGFAQTFNTKFSLLETGMIVAVPYVFASIAMVWWSHHSDRTGERVWHVAGPLFLAGVAIPVALFLNSPFLVMVAMTITAMGVYSALPVFWYLPTTFLTGAAAAGGIALINSIGNASGFFAPYIPASPTTRPAITRSRCSSSEGSASWAESSRSCSRPRPDPTTRRRSG